VRKLPLMLALAIVGAVVAPPVATAGDTRCTGVIGPVTVKGNVIVPSGSTCELQDTRVKGNVKVERNAELAADGADIRGNVDCFGACFLFEEEFDGSRVGGNVKAEPAAQVGLFDTEVGGQVQCAECEFLDAIDSSIGGDVNVTKELDGSFFCGNTVGGGVEFGENIPFLVIGFDPAEPGCTGNVIGGNLKVEKNRARENESGPPEIIIGDNVVGGNMQVFANRGPLTIVRNQVRQDLQCKKNEPPPTGGGNTARKKEGQCRSL
jgi:hypothetical protein